MRKSIGVATLCAAAIVGVAPSSRAGANFCASLMGHADVWEPGIDYCSTLAFQNCLSLTDYTVTPYGSNNLIAAYISSSYCDWCALPSLDVIGVDFGITYTQGYWILEWQSCADIEVRGPNWPQSGSGVSVGWSSPQTGDLVLLGWFRVATYAGYGPLIFQLREHPQYGQAQATDPNNQVDDLSWSSVSHDGSSAIGNWKCCGPTPTRNTTWGSIKSLYGQD